MLAIRFINLDRADERRAFMERQGERLGLPLERVRACEPGDIAADERERLAASWQRPLTGAEIGCFLSHRAAWERIAAEDRPALVIEDDAVLSRRLPEALPAIAALEGVDLLNLEDFGKRRFLARGEGTPLAAGIRRVRCFRDKAGTGAYVLWPAGARTLLRLAQGRAAPADAFIHGSGLNAAVCEPALVLQLEVMARRGLTPTFGTASTIQAPRRKLPPTPANARFVARRLAAQLRLLPHHASRLTRAVYRRVAVEDADFT